MIGPTYVLKKIVENFATSISGHFTVKQSYTNVFFGRDSVKSMRILHIRTFEFKNFYDTSLPKYAILSHRWGSEEDEVSYKQFRKRSVPADLPGLLKIQAFCRLADERGFQWAWADTCCIDNRSSVELSEAINSMFKWYKRSAECYVHMADVEFSDAKLALKPQFKKDFWLVSHGWASLRKRFEKSSWF